MAKLMCGASHLKCDKQILRNEIWTTRTFESCDLVELEDSKHLILICPSLSNLRNEMFNYINDSCHGIGRQVLSSITNNHAMSLGKHDSDYPDNINWEICCIIAKYVYQMYIWLIKQ